MSHSICPPNTHLAASIVLRLAPSFLRLGSWEVFKPTDPHTGLCVFFFRFNSSHLLGM